MSSPDIASDKKKKSPHGSPSGRSSSRGAPFRHPDFTEDQIQRLTSTLFNLGTTEDSLGTLDPGGGMQADLLDDSRVRQTRSKSEGARSSVSEESVLTIVLSRLSQTQMQLARTQQALSEAQHKLKQRDIQILLLKHKMDLMRRSRQQFSVPVEPTSDKTSPERLVRLDAQVKMSPSQGYESGSDWNSESGGVVSEGHVEEVVGRRPAHPSSLEVLCRPPLMDIPSVVPVDYDLVLRNVGALNQEVGEGTAQVSYSESGGGATLRVPEAVPLTLYSNGIQVGSGGPFRDMYEPSTQQFLVDIMDGYFPAELQSTFPRGVPLRVKDKRHVSYKDPVDGRPPFWGQGKRLASGGEAPPPLLPLTRWVGQPSGNTEGVPGGAVRQPSGNTEGVPGAAVRQPSGNTEGVPGVPGVAADAGAPGAATSDEGLPGAAVEVAPPGSGTVSPPVAASTAKKTPPPKTKRVHVVTGPARNKAAAKQEKLALVNEDPLTQTAPSTMPATMPATTPATMPATAQPALVSTQVEVPSQTEAPLPYLDPSSSLRLKVRSESGDKLYHVCMLVGESVAELRRKIDVLRGAQEKGVRYDLVTCYPTGMLGEDGAALGDYGVTSNSVLYLRARNHQQDDYV